MKISVPFYSNTKDDLHCVQACLKSALAFYFPRRNYSFDYLDTATKHKKGKFTWNSALLMFLAKLGFEAIDIEDFDYVKFGKLGEKFLRKIWTKEMFTLQKSFSDLDMEQKLAHKLIKAKGINLQMHPAQMADVRRLFKKGYLIFCSINPFVLDHQDGYTSHLVLLTEVRRDTIIFHDPGFPPAKDRKTSSSLFFKAMCYPTKAYANLIAIKRKLH